MCKDEEMREYEKRYVSGCGGMRKACEWVGWNGSWIDCLAKYWSGVARLKFYNELEKCVFVELLSQLNRVWSGVERCYRESERMKKEWR